MAVQAQFTLYNSSVTLNASQPLSTGCTNALLASINCPSSLIDLAGTGDFMYSDPTYTPQICAQSCLSSLQGFHNGVASACKNDPNPWSGTPATWAGDVLWAYANQTCLTNSTTGRFCTDEVLDWYIPLNGTTNFQSIPKQHLCSDCFYHLFISAQASSFSNYDAGVAANWQTIQSICKTSFPTSVPSPAANMSLTALGFANTSAQATAPCLSGNMYQVASGDTCNSIAAAHNVASGTLIAINNLYADCSQLSVGASICLPLSCTARTVQSSDTCWSLAASISVGFSQILSWNPAINSDCSNLLTGQTVCLSPPGGTYTPTIIPGASPTADSPYGTATVTPPTPTASGSTPQCARWYEVVSGDYCQKISLNMTITVDLFEAINPSINSGCTNLQIGEYYCVLPLQGWNQTALSNCSTATTVTAPGPTASGASSSCYAWHTVVSGDYCDLIDQQYNITFAQLQSWNPALDSNCDNLILGDAYCVNGTPPPVSCSSGGSATTSSSTSTSSTSTKTTSTSTTTTSASVSTPTPHQPNMATGCKTFYEAVSGDYCDKIASAYGITTSTFISWNPDVKSDCSALWVDEYYCVGM